MTAPVIDIHRILKRLPHRYPFLLVDRVIESVPGDYLVAIKNVTVNEPFFPGHFPVKPVMPGVLVLEALAQATGLLAMETTPEMVAPDSLYYLVGIDHARFKRPVEPGDQLFLKATLLKRKREIWGFLTDTSVDGKPVASADIMCTQRVA